MLCDVYRVCVDGMSVLCRSSQASLVARRSNIDDLSSRSSQNPADVRSTPAAVLQRGRAAAPRLGTRRGDRRRSGRGGYPSSSAAGDGSRRRCSRRCGRHQPRRRLQDPSKRLADERKHSSYLAVTAFLTQHSQNSLN